MKTVSQVALEVAASSLDVREVGISNSGPMVDQMLASVGLPPHEPWCAAAVYYWIREAARQLGVADPYIKTGYCPYVASWAKSIGILHDTPQAGDAFLLYGPTRAHHTGLVAAVSGPHVETIEGNTNPGGSVDGYGVFRRNRVSGMKFVRFGGIFGTPRPHEEPVPVPKADPGVFTLSVSGQMTEIAMPVSAGRAVVGARVFAEALGYSVAWDYEQQAVVMDGKLIDLQAVIQGDHAYLPVRDLAGYFGLTLEVDDKTKVVNIANAALVGTGKPAKPAKPAKKTKADDAEK